MFCAVVFSILYSGVQGGFEELEVKDPESALCCMFLDLGLVPCQNKKYRNDRNEIGGSSFFLDWWVRGCVSKMTSLLVGS